VKQLSKVWFILRAVMLTLAANLSFFLPLNPFTASPPCFGHWTNCIRAFVRAWVSAHPAKACSDVRHCCQTIWADVNEKKVFGHISCRNFDFFFAGTTPQTSPNLHDRSCYFDSFIIDQHRWNPLRRQGLRLGLRCCNGQSSIFSHFPTENCSLRISGQGPKLQI